MVEPEDDIGDRVAGLGEDLVGGVAAALADDLDLEACLGGLFGEPLGAAVAVGVRIDDQGIAGTGVGTGIAGSAGAAAGGEGEGGRREECGGLQELSHGGRFLCTGDADPQGPGRASRVSLHVGDSSVTGGALPSAVTLPSESDGKATGRASPDEL